METGPAPPPFCIDEIPFKNCITFPMQIIYDKFMNIRNLGNKKKAFT